MYWNLPYRLTYTTPSWPKTSMALLSSEIHRPSPGDLSASSNTLMVKLLPGIKLGLFEYRTCVTPSDVRVAVLFSLLKLYALFSDVPHSVNEKIC